MWKSGNVTWQAFGETATNYHLIAVKHSRKKDIPKNSTCVTENAAIGIKFVCVIMSKTNRIATNKVSDVGEIVQ